MYIVIGKIKDPNTKKIEACRIIDSNTKEVKIISAIRIRDAVKRGIKVQGFKKFTIITNNKNFDVQTETTKAETSKFKWRKVPLLTGAGELVNKEDEKYLTVFGWKGFAEEKRYQLFDWEGKEVTLSVDEFIQKLKADEINGASFDYKNNKPILLRELNIEIV